MKQTCLIHTRGGLDPQTCQHAARSQKGVKAETSGVKMLWLPVFKPVKKGERIFANSQAGLEILLSVLAETAREMRESYLHCAVIN